MTATKIQLLVVAYFAVTLAYPSTDYNKDSLKSLKEITTHSSLNQMEELSDTNDTAYEDSGATTSSRQKRETTPPHIRCSKVSGLLKFACERQNDNPISNYFQTPLIEYILAPRIVTIWKAFTPLKYGIR